MDQLGNLVSTELHGRDDDVGPGTQHPVFDAGFLAAGNDEDLRVQFAGCQRDNEVIGIVGKDRQESDGPVDAGFPQGGIRSWVAADERVALAVDRFDRGLVVCDDDERELLVSQLAADGTADLAEAADNVVVLHPADPPLHLLSGEDADSFQLTLNHQSGELGREGDDGTEPAEDQYDGKVATGDREPVHFVELCGRDGRQGHVERFGGSDPVLDEQVAAGPEGQDQRHEDENLQDVPR